MACSAKYILFLTFVLHCGCVFTLNGRQNVLLQNAVKTLLGFKEVAPSRGARSAESDPGAAPRYMQNLYEQYKYGTISKGKTTGNTVRSISAQIGVVNDQHMFVFNLSSVTVSEKVFSGEVHLYRKKMKTRSSAPDIVLKLHEVAPTYLSELHSHVLRGRGHGWHSYDLTAAVTSCLSTGRSHPHLLAISLHGENEKPLPLRRFMQNSYRPFLILFSNDTQNITLDHLDPYFNPLGVKEQLIDPETGSELSGRRRKKKRMQSVQGHSRNKGTESEDTGITTHPNHLQDMLTENKIPEMSYPENKSPLRNKRSIFDNEIPEDPYESVMPETPFNVPQTNPTILHSRNQTPRPSLESSLTDSPDSKLIPYPKDYSKRRNRRKNKRKGKKYRRRGKQKEDDEILPLLEDWGVDSSSEAQNAGTSQLCGKRKLVVDFADIGWSDWIISPKSFEAHYCAGQCPFPLTKGLQPSNHATIQSLVHVIGIHSDVPAPCCVPDSLSSVTLLYFDENHNVVLKNYPAMTVKSCACR